MVARETVSRIIIALAIAAMAAWLLCVWGCSLHIYFDRHYHGEAAKQIESGQPDDLQEDKRWDILQP